MGYSQKKENSNSGSLFPILVWQGSSNTIVERNRIIDCDFGISFGNASGSGVQHTGGVIRNNFIKGYENSDFAIGIVKSPDAKILNNTIYSPGAWPYSIEARFPETTNCLIMNNLADETIWGNRDGASSILTTNITDATSDDFVDVANGDLHLASDSVPAVDAGTPTADRTLDIDCEEISDGKPDIGADEFQSTVIMGINGTITDVDGEPIKWALVIATQKPDVKKRAFTNEDGYYEITDLEPGAYWVIAIKKGYKASFARVTVEAGKTTRKDFQLQ